MVIALDRILFSGNEAIARGAYEAGVKVCSAYPGTPSTEVFEALPQYRDSLYCEWAPNEKVATEVAYGASLAGVRSLCAMKHVGVNVAADPIFTAAYNGVGGGFVIVSADDPSMHSSQNEQDNRHYARAAKLAMVEPSDSQECLDFMREAYRISEQFDIPVLFRTTTRVAHSKSIVTFGEREEQEAKPYARNTRKNIASPANAFLNHPKLEKTLEALEAYGCTSPLNRMELNGTKVGVIYDSSDAYSSGIYEKFKGEADAKGLEIVAAEAFTADNKSDLSTQVAKCQQAGADLVFLPIYYQEASQILIAANKSGYAPVFFGCDGMDGILTMEGFDTSLAEGLMLLTPFAADAQDEKTQAFVTAYKEAYGDTPNQFAADAYDVVYAIYQAAVAGGINGDMDASDVCDALKAQFTSMTFDGLTGDGMTWDASGAVSKAPKAVVIKDGAYAAM